jgi:hypothetical protein
MGSKASWVQAANAHERVYVPGRPRRRYDGTSGWPISHRVLLVRACRARRTRRSGHVCRVNPVGWQLPVLQPLPAWLTSH